MQRVHKIKNRQVIHILKGDRSLVSDQKIEVLCGTPRVNVRNTVTAAVLSNCVKCISINSSAMRKK